MLGLFLGGPESNEDRDTHRHESHTEEGVGGGGKALGRKVGEKDR